MYVKDENRFKHRKAQINSFFKLNRGQIVIFHFDFFPLLCGFWANAAIFKSHIIITLRYLVGRQRNLLLWKRWNISIFSPILSCKGSWPENKTNINNDHIQQTAVFLLRPIFQLFMISPKAVVANDWMQTQSILCVKSSEEWTSLLSKRELEGHKSALHKVWKSRYWCFLAIKRDKRRLLYSFWLYYHACLGPTDFCTLKDIGHDE